MTKTKLAIAVVLTNCINKTLNTYKESKIVTTADSTNYDLTVEGHLYRY